MAINLSELVKTGPEIRPPRIVLYGVQGIGKTTFAAGAPKPLFIQAEDGLGKLEYPRLPMVESFEQLLDQVGTIIEQGGEYETIVLDTLDAIEKLIFAEVASAKGKPSIEDIGYAKGYVFALDRWETLLQGLNMLRDQGKVIICLAHSIVKAHNDPETEPYDRYRMNLHDKGAAKILGWADMVLFANYKVYSVKSEGKDRTRATGKGERYLYTQERPQHWGKNRYGLPYELPFPAVGAYDNLINAMGSAVEPEETKEAA